MKLRALLVFSLLVFPGAAVRSSGRQEAGATLPRYTANGQLLFPEGYREWIYLSSGLGMSYSKAGGDQFTNVFVTPAAYREFLSSGRWPEKTMFVVEERESASEGSINKAGHYQAALAGLGVEVKDSARFPETWAYFTFRAEATSAGPVAKTACWQCHEDHAAVEHSFVQFYPTLLPIARKFGTLKDATAARP